MLSSWLRTGVKRAPALLAAALLCLGVVAAPAMARDLDQDEALQLRRAGKLVPLDTLLQEVQRRYPSARLLEVELEIEDGELVYELEVLTTGGQVRELEFDAATGVLVKDEEED
jgi:uncharacterized membrane protein YkoI